MLVDICRWTHKPASLLVPEPDLVCGLADAQARLEQTVDCTLQPEVGGIPRNRVVGLPDELVTLLNEHRRQQLEERMRAGSLWQEGGWVFTTSVGRLIAANSDYHEWRALHQRAGVRHARLHDARHTAATVLLVLGVPERTVMSIMGWSSTSMAARYQHVTDPIRREVANRVG